MNERNSDCIGANAQQPTEEAKRVQLPQPSADQGAYVAEIVNWAKESFKPDTVIGGPKTSVD